MNKEDRQVWLKNMQEKVSFARELEEWMELPITKKIIEEMIDKRIKLQKEIMGILDEPKNKADNEILNTLRQQRNVIKWVLESLANTVYDGERAKKEIERFEKFEKDKEEVGART